MAIVPPPGSPLIQRSNFDSSPEGKKDHLPKIIKQIQACLPNYLPQNKQRSASEYLEISKSMFDYYQSSTPHSFSEEEKSQLITSCLYALYAMNCSNTPPEVQKEAEQLMTSYMNFPQMFQAISSRYQDARQVKNDSK